MKFYTFPASPNCRKVQALICHLGIEVETEMVNIMGERPAHLLKLNPNGFVPVLEDEGLILWESEAILQYLADKFQAETLFPKDAKRRADVVRWQCWNLAHWGPSIQPLVYENFVKGMMGKGTPDADRVKEAEEKFHRFAKVLDEHLKNRAFIAGEELTLADFSLAAPFAYWQIGRVPAENYMRILAWYDRIQGLEAWQKSQPQMPSSG